MGIGRRGPGWAPIGTPIEGSEKASGATQGAAVDPGQPGAAGASAPAAFAAARLIARSISASTTGATAAAISAAAVLGLQVGFTGFGAAATAAATSSSGEPAWKTFLAVASECAGHSPALGSGAIQGSGTRLPAAAAAACLCMVVAWRLC